MTRNCTLYCEHCLRGDKECINISPNVIESIFADVTGVNLLLLTGGEPLIAVNELEYLIKVIKEQKIWVNKIAISTNGTILSARVLKILKELSEISQLIIGISDDIFHMLELERLGLLELRNKNCDVLKKYFRAEEFGKKFESGRKVPLSCVGRAQYLTRERLAEINKLACSNYVIDEGLRTMVQPKTYIDYNTVYGYVPIDVYGNIVSYGQSYSEEDEESKRTGFNVCNNNFKKAVTVFVADVEDRFSLDVKMK